VAFAYVRGYAIVKEIFDALTQGDRGGQIAHTLVFDKNQQVMQDWVNNLLPQALGPLLMILSASPKAFSAEDDQDSKSYNMDEAHLLQQQAIERCLSWISQKPNANLQFEDAIIRMNRDGVRPPQAGTNYCKNKLRLDSFMAEKILGHIPGNNRMRARYAENVKSLGARMNNHCTYSVAYKGPAFAPIQELKASYQGPNID